MESLGHYLLREPILSGDLGTLEIFEGQDVRTGVTVLVFRPQTAVLPKLQLPSTMPWVDQEQNAWIANVPVGAVQASLLAGRVEVKRLSQWTKQLIELVHQAQQQRISIGCILPQLVWARGSKVWLGGVGIPAESQNWDFAGLLASIRHIAGDAYPALPWREALEDWVGGEGEYETLRSQLESVTSEAVSSVSIPVIPVFEAPAPTIESKSKTLNIQESTPIEPPKPVAPPPRRVQISEPIDPPFKVISPTPPMARRAIWPWLLGLVVVAALGVGTWWMLTQRSQPNPTRPNPTNYPVEFRINPDTANASISILEIPSGSQMPLNSEVLRPPGQIEFDRPGIYRIRIRVAGRSPVEQLITVPSSSAYTINLR